MPRHAEVSSAEVRSAVSEFPPLLGDTVSPRDYTLAITLAQDAATSSLWSDIFDHAGERVPVTLAPYGNAVPSLDEPHFDQVATIVEPEGVILGGQASASTSARFTVEVEWPLDGRPIRVTGLTS